jgi:hypothetical protein
MDLHQACRVLIVSPYDECEGLVNLDKFGQSSRPSLPLDNIKPHPSAWLKDATSQWIKSHNALFVSNEGKHTSMLASKNEQTESRQQK